MSYDQYETKDSGAREHFDSGMQRDTEAGKPRFDLFLPEGVPYEEQFLTRIAALLGRGAMKYEDRNWEQADSLAEIARAKSSAFRHFMQWICGERDEDHAAAVVFNLLVVETTERKLALAEEPDFDALADEIIGQPILPCDSQGSATAPAVIQDAAGGPQEPPAAGGMIQRIHVETPATVSATQLVHEAMNRRDRIRREDLRM